MIQIVFKPEPAPVVRGEGLYRSLFNGEHIGLFVRARNAREAERKMMIVFRHELSYKTIDFDAGDYSVYERKENGNAEEGSEAAEGGGAADSADIEDEEVT